MDEFKSQGGRAIPPPKRIALLLAVAAGLAAINYVVGRLQTSTAIGVSAVTVFFIAQVAFISLFCGRGNNPTWLKWATFAWIFILIDAEMFARAPSLEFGGETLTLSGLFISQFGLLVTWLVMGSGHLVRRMTMTIPPLVCLFLIFAGDRHQSYNSHAQQWVALIGCLIIPLFVVLFILRVFRFRMERVVFDDKLERSASQQFNLRHAMVLTSVFAIVMAAFKARQESLVTLLENVWTDDTPVALFLTLGFSSAIAVIIACWTALGAGKPFLRYGILSLVVTAIGVGVSLWACRVNVAAKQFGNWWQAGLTYEMGRFAEAEWLWLAWYISSGFLLVAGLIFFRAQGLRFIRIGRSAQSG